MIKYCLLCKNCTTEFESWFSSSKEFDRLKKLKHLKCQNCNSIKIEKSLMAPSLSNTKKKTYEKNSHKIKDIKKKIKNYQKFIKENFEYVGNNFAYEARLIHYDKKKEKKGIYGQAKKEEIKDLKDEGIEVENIPWIQDKEN